MKFLSFLSMFAAMCAFTVFMMWLGGALFLGTCAGEGYVTHKIFTSGVECKFVDKRTPNGR